MPILKGNGNTLLCSRFAYGKRISPPAKSVNSEHRHAFLIGNLVLASAFRFQVSAFQVSAFPALHLFVPHFRFLVSQFQLFPCQLSPFHFPRLGASLRVFPSWVARVYSYQSGARCPFRATSISLLPWNLLGPSAKVSNAECACMTEIGRASCRER